MMKNPARKCFRAGFFHYVRSGLFVRLLHDGLAIVVAQKVEDLELVVYDCGLEALVIAVFRCAPLNLAQGEHTREEHILEVLVSRDVLSPQIGLHAENVLLEVRIDPLVRIEAVAFLDRQISADGERLVRSVFCLIIIEIEVEVTM